MNARYHRSRAGGAETLRSYSMDTTANPTLAHFMDLVLQGKRSGCSTGESASRELAMAFLDKGLSLDDSAIQGFGEFMQAAKSSPQTARVAVGAHDRDSRLPDKHSEAHHDTLDRMERMGGGFVQTLAALWRKADQANHAKLFSAFGDYYREYSK